MADDYNGGLKRGLALRGVVLSHATVVSSLHP
jgi:hypothetical protein